MAPLVDLVLASAIAPAAGASPPEQGGRGAMTTAHATARVLPALRVRQGEQVEADGPAIQVNRQPDGSVLVEFT